LIQALELMGGDYEQPLLFDGKADREVEAVRFDRCAKSFFSPFAATVMCWL
jgi:hypothetical protein